MIRKCFLYFESPKKFTKINLIVTEKWLKLGKIKGIFAKSGKSRNEIMRVTA